MALLDAHADSFDQETTVLDHGSAYRIFRRVPEKIKFEAIAVRRKVG